MKIPKQAKRVFKGVIFNVYHWQQNMFDGTPATFEMLERPGNVSIIPIVDNKIILIRERQPQYKKPITRLMGGRTEKGENNLLAAKRELLEETGLKAKSWTLLHIDEPYVDKMDWKIYTYIAHNCKFVAKQNLDAGEKIDIFAVSFEEFIKLIQDKTIYCGNFGFEILKMKLEGKLKEFKQKLFKK